MNRAILEEVVRRFHGRVAVKERSGEWIQAILATRFAQQLAFIKSPARRKAAFCTRRAGKTEADAAYLLTAALGGPDRLVLFVAKTRGRAVDLTWKPVRKLCEQFGVASKENMSTYRREFANGSEIRWTGADDMDELKKKRGDKLWLVIIDEAQDFEFSILTDLVDDVFGPGLEDLGGTICLTGTPGIVCAGYWFNVTRPDEGEREPGWDVHEWSVLANPHMAHMTKRLPQLKAERRWADDNPTYLREWLGRWVNDAGALFYAFDPTRNTYRPDANGFHAYGPGWMHVRGWDLGATDHMALVYWGFHPDHRELFEVYSWKKSGASTDEVMAEAKRIEKELGLDVVGSVADTGGLGKLVVTETAARTGEAFEAAKKTEKGAHVRLMNDDFRAGRIKLVAGSPYADEIAVLPKVPDWDEKEKGKPAPEHPRFENHCCDSGLYGWRKAWNFLHEKKEDEPPAGSPEAYALEEQEMEDRLAEMAELEAEQPWWESEAL